jgi:protein required for attachment to host cells
MKKETWVIVANSSYAKIYKAENNTTLIEIQEFEHPESRLDNKDLVSSKPGRTNDSVGFRRSSMEFPTSPKHHEFELFAKQISQYLDQAQETGQVGRLYISASPIFLGILRQALSHLINDLIAGQVDRDMTHLKPADIRNHLPPVL